MSDPEDIRGWQRLSSRITTSGRIEDKDLPRLAEIGVVHVINLALDEHPEALAGEGEKLAARGIRYTHIPVPFDAPTNAHYAAFTDALESDQAPVHVHCIANYRVSAFFYRWHQEASGMDAAAAREIMERIWQPHTAEHPNFLPWKAFVEQVSS